MAGAKNSVEIIPKAHIFVARVREGGLQTKEGFVDDVGRHLPDSDNMGRETYDLRAIVKTS